jgi:hypothetical protein
MGPPEQGGTVKAFTLLTLFGVTVDPGDADFDRQRKCVVGPPSHDTAHYTPSRDSRGGIRWSRFGRRIR